MIEARSRTRELALVSAARNRTRRASSKRVNKNRSKPTANKTSPKTAEKGGSKLAKAISYAVGFCQNKQVTHTIIGNIAEKVELKFSAWVAAELKLALIGPKKTKATRSALSIDVDRTDHLVD